MQWTTLITRPIAGKHTIDTSELKSKLRKSDYEPLQNEQHGGELSGANLLVQRNAVTSTHTLAADDSFPFVLTFPFTFKTTIIVTTGPFGHPTTLATTIRKELPIFPSSPPTDTYSKTTPQESLPLPTENVPKSTTSESSLTQIETAYPVFIPSESSLPIAIPMVTTNSVDTEAFVHTACNQDNAYRALLRFSNSADIFCPTFLSLLPISPNPTSAPPIPLPNYIAPFSPVSISSACLCFEHRTTSMNSSGSAATSTPSLATLDSSPTSPSLPNLPIVLTTSPPSTAAPAGMAGGSGGDLAKLVPAFVLVPLGVIICVLTILCKYPALLCHHRRGRGCSRCCISSSLCAEKKAEEGAYSPSKRGCDGVRLCSLIVIISLFNFFVPPIPLPCFVKNCSCSTLKLSICLSFQPLSIYPPS